MPALFRPSLPLTSLKDAKQAYSNAAAGVVPITPANPSPKAPFVNSGCLLYL